MSSDILLDKIIMFDKKSVYLGNSISEFNKIRNILEEHKVKSTKKYWPSDVWDNRKIIEEMVMGIE